MACSDITRYNVIDESFFKIICLFYFEFLFQADFG